MSHMRGWRVGCRLRLSLHDDRLIVVTALNALNSVKRGLQATDGTEFHAMTILSLLSLENNLIQDANFVKKIAING
jgi:hypothetical protein